MIIMNEPTKIIDNDRYTLNGKLHREDGPAVEYPNGDKHWFNNGLHHRTDGPAVERANGRKQWFINGVKINALNHEHFQSEYPDLINQFLNSP